MERDDSEPGPACAGPSTRPTFEKGISEGEMGRIRSQTLEICGNIRPCSVRGDA